MIKEIRTISVEEASSLLANHRNPRSIDDSLVEEMLNDLKNNTFNKDEANICLKDDGTLLYGQHIISAVIKFNSPVELNVYKCENPEETKTTPMGKLNRASKYKYIGNERREYLKSHPTINGESERILRIKAYRKYWEKRKVVREQMTTKRPNNIIEK